MSFKLLCICSVFMLFLGCGSRMTSDAGHDHGQNIAHQHQHPHDGIVDHGHSHQGIRKTSHTHEHVHGHMHATHTKPIHGGLIIPLGHIHDADGDRKYYAECITNPTKIELYFLVETSDSVQACSLDCDQLPAELSKGPGQTEELVFRRVAGKFVSRLPERAAKHAGEQLVVVQGIEIAGQEFKLKLSFAAWPPVRSAGIDR